MKKYWDGLSSIGQAKLYGSWAAFPLVSMKLHRLVLITKDINELVNIKLSKKFHQILLHEGAKSYKVAKQIFMV